MGGGLNREKPEYTNIVGFLFQYYTVLQISSVVQRTIRLWTSRYLSQVLSRIYLL
jgi:hypothetical protein